MRNIVALRALVTALDPGPDREPTSVELAAIEAEMPLIAAEVELLDAQITAIDRSIPSELDVRRVRRARRRVLAARRTLANRAGTAGMPGGAA
ncbi:DUF6284 family protein [Streptomyces sp. NPDC004838]